MNTGIDLNAAKRNRDKRLRRRILMTLYIARGFGNGRLSGRALKENAEGGMPSDQQFEDDTHAMSLIRDMILKGYVEEHKRQRRRGEQPGLEHVELSITA